MISWLNAIQFNWIGTQPSFYSQNFHSVPNKFNGNLFHSPFKCSEHILKYFLKSRIFYNANQIPLGWEPQNHSAIQMLSRGGTQPLNQPALSSLQLKYYVTLWRDVDIYVIYNFLQPQNPLKCDWWCSCFPQHRGKSVGLFNCLWYMLA